MLELIANNPIAAAPVVVSALAAAAGALLSALADRSVCDDNEIADAILDRLPQTQCGQCGYPGCKPYAVAIARGERINKCPPGGAATIDALAHLLGTPCVPLDPEHGVEQLRAVAYIREDECIGCTKCIQACPVDAILGAAKLMHTVIAAECTGCDLCVEPCPVDCIEMRPLQETVLPMPSVPARACIRCGACADACPVALLPQQLFWHARTADHAALQRQRLFDCIECGACSRVCPSDIPLVPYFRAAKQQTRDRDTARERAVLARERFEFHEQRIQRLNTEHAQQRELQTGQSQVKPLAERSRLIEAAVARVRARQSAGAGEQSAAVDEAIERARRDALLRAAQTTAAQTQEHSVAATPAQLQHQCTAIEQKLLRARQKLITAEIEGDSDSAAVLRRSIANHEVRIAAIRELLLSAAGGSLQVPQ